MSRLVVVDHPILDMVVTIEADELERLCLEPDSTILARPEDEALYSKLEDNSATTRVPGGAGLNSLRAVAWWLDMEDKALPALGFFGAVGCDGNAEVLRQAIEKSGITAKLQVCSDVPTAKSAILVEGKRRTMVTDLGAAGQMSLGKAQEFDDLLAPLLGPEGALVFTTGYYVAKDPEGARRLAKESEGRFVLALTLAATFVATAPTVAEFMQGAQIVFGTLAEAVAFSKENGGPEDGDGVAKFIQQWPGLDDRRVIITDGPRLVRFASNSGLSRYPVAKIDTGLIVDDNGAGDAFAGAFLASHLCGGSTQECVAAGMQGAREALQNIGCNFRDSKVLLRSRSTHWSCTIL